MPGVAVAPGVAMWRGSGGFVRIAMVENEQRIRYGAQREALSCQHGRQHARAELGLIECGGTAHEVDIEPLWPRSPACLSACSSG